MSSKKKSAKPRTLKKTLRIRFHKTELLEAALTHPSYRNENSLKRLEDFDRLEFFGDTILNFVICRKLYKVFPDANEGLLSRLRSILVSRKVLSRIAKETGLVERIRLGKSLVRQSQHLKVKVLADCFEALLAALFFDQGFERTERFILKHFSSYFDSKKLFRLDPNPKSTLQEIVQKKWQKLPSYTSQLKAPGVQVEVAVHSKLKAVAVARNRREGEEKAARLLVRKIRQKLSSRSKKKVSGKKARRTF